MALTITPGSATADSYADVTYAEAYFLTTSRAAQWVEIDGSDAKEALLREAMPFIEALAWLGNRATVAQALEWPRIGGSRRRWAYGSVTGGLVDLRGRLWASDVVPEPIKKAQCEMALALVAGEGSSGMGSQIKSFSADGLSVTFDYAARAGAPLVHSVSSVMILVGPFHLGIRLLKA